MRHDLPLRAALLSNAMFSLGSAALLIVAPDRVGAWLGVEADPSLRLVGTGLALFAGMLVHVATRPRLATWKALAVSAADFAWVAASVACAVIFSQTVPALGIDLILEVAGLVGVFGLWQVLAAGHAHRHGRDGGFRHCVIVGTAAPAQALWEIVADLGAIHRYAPGLADSALLDGRTPGVGAVRRCRDYSGGQWDETCTAFVPGRAYTVRFLTEAPEFPFPVHWMHGGWEVTPTATGSQVAVWWELLPKGPLPVALLLPLFGLRADREITRIVGRMADTALGQGAATTTRRRSTRLLPIPC